MVNLNEIDLWNELVDLWRPGRAQKAGVSVVHIIEDGCETK